MHSIIFVVFGVLFLGVFSFQESYSQYLDEESQKSYQKWSEATKLVLEEYVDQTLLKNEKIISDSIVTKTIRSPEDVLPQRYFIKIVYDVEDGKDTQTRVLGMKVIFPEIKTPDNAFLETVFETDYIPPKKIADNLDQYESNYVKNLAKLVVCKEGFANVIKDADGSPACVKRDSVEKLVERGWAKS